ncbi:MAG: radical SAM protein [wastewater metagenome]|nr:radical SAM protein [Candidatus Loosdrechtia aerotolerans]
MKINEIFKSIQGETSYSGLPCTFIRITGCNLRCSYCDTTYAYEEGKEMSVDSILEYTRGCKTKLICITGGEPLSNSGVSSLIRELLKENYTVLVETNGSYDIRTIPREAIRIMDVKCPGSKMSHLMHWQNIGYLTKLDEVKFVLTSREDYDWMKGVIQKYDLSKITNITLGTAFNTVSPRSVVRWALEDNLEIRFQLQIHKYLWEPNTRGV